MDVRTFYLPLLAAVTLTLSAGLGAAQAEALHQSPPEFSLRAHTFSATDLYAASVTDTCIERRGFPATVSPIVALPGGVSTEVSGDGESVVVYSSQSALDVFEPSEPCCVCGIINPATNEVRGCVAFGTVCCCASQIDLNGKILCYCQGGKACW